jgi:hypothetical protein
MEVDLHMETLWLCVLEQTTIILLYGINRLVLLTKAVNDCFEVGTEFLFLMGPEFIFHFYIILQQKLSWHT